MLSSRAMAFALIRAMRPRQWVKNLFVLAPLVFSKSLLDTEATTRGLTAFALFCAAASAIYLINDVADAESDRAHPQKRKRPIASGELSPRVAIAAAVALGIGALASAFLVSTALAAILAAYFALNFAYSSGLKRIPYVDVICIAAGFELRVAAGAVAAAVPASIYLLLATFFLASFLGLGKRMHEFGQTRAEIQRAVLARYDQRVLSRLLVLFGAAPIAIYVAYVIDPDTREVFESRLLPFTTVFAVIGVVRFLQLTKSQRDTEGPTEAMLRDPLFLGNFLAWSGSMLFMLYGRG